MLGGVANWRISASRLWPNNINLDILHQHDTKTNPPGFNTEKLKN